MPRRKIKGIRIGSGYKLSNKEFQQMILSGVAGMESGSWLMIHRDEDKSYTVIYEGEDVFGNKEVSSE